MTDVEIQNEGTIFLFHLQTEAAREWVLENVDRGSPYLGPYTLAVEHRYARDLAAGMQNAGLEVI